MFGFFCICSAPRRWCFVACHIIRMHMKIIRAQYRKPSPIVRANWMSLRVFRNWQSMFVVFIKMYWIVDRMGKSELFMHMQRITCKCIDLNYIFWQMGRYRHTAFWDFKLSINGRPAPTNRLARHLYWVHRWGEVSAPSILTGIIFDRKKHFSNFVLESDLKKILDWICVHTNMRWKTVYHIIHMCSPLEIQ